MTNPLCVEPEWASSAYGGIPWGGSLGVVPGGPLPAAAPFDVYCVGPCGPMSVFSTYDDVELIGDPVGDPHFFVDPDTEDFALRSGGTTTPYAAHMRIDLAVPDTYTFEVTFKILEMPTDFTDIPNRHIYMGTVDAQGCCAGVLFSAVGLTYTGSVAFGHGLGGFGMAINTPLQLLPDSIGLVVPDVYYTLRLAVDSIAKTVFIYVTETMQIPITGHQLRYILPAILSDDGFINPGDETIVSVGGQAGTPSSVQLASICMGHGLLIPNLPPVADAGKDQSTRACSVIRLDGRASFDPEGSPVSYKWRLTEGPDTSVYVFAGHDGGTHSFTLTNKFFSESLEAYNDVTPIMVGDVLLVGTLPYDITTTGIDGTYGFYVQIDGFDLDGSMSTSNFKLLRQNSLAGATSAQPTFYPDVSGVYRFDLVVFDGSLHSPPTNVIVSVVESHVPRGITPDLSFLWSYLSDFYKLVSNTGAIDVFWSSLAQVTASELLTLWQHEYSKSLRDVQRTFQRRWLHYDLFIQEPLIEQTSTRVLYAGVESFDIPEVGLVCEGGALELAAPVFADTTIFLSPEDPAAFTPDQIYDQLRRQLKSVDARFEVQLYTNAIDPTISRLLITAPFPFVFTGASTVTTVFPTPVLNDLPRGTAGLVLATNTYLVERTLTFSDVQEGDHLVVDGVAYRIQRVITNPLDAYAAQRIVTSDPLPTVMGHTWVIVGATRSVSINFYNALCSAGDVAVYEVVDLLTNVLAYIPATVISAAVEGGGPILTEASPITPYVSQPARYSVFLYAVYRRTYMPLDPLVVEVPTLQELIRNTDDSAVLRQNIDFYREEYRGQACLRFVTASDTDQPDVWQLELPPKRMWAEVSYIDNRPVIEQNFGLAAQFTLDDLAQLPTNADYLSIVRGLWYAYFNGPTLYNLRAGTQILLGLPFAEEAGTIVEVRPDFSINQGRILVQDLNAQEIVRAYTYPGALSLETNPATGKPYAVGDTIAQFTPLVTGAEVVDYVKDPKWFQGYMNQGVFYEVEKFFKFLVRVDSSVFSLSTLVFVKSFILRIKPTYTYPLLVVLKRLAQTTVDTTDARRYDGTLFINTFPGNYEESGLGGSGWTKIGGAFDDPRSAGGGWWSQFSSDSPLTPPPVYATETHPIRWGFDRTYLCPVDVIIGTLTTTWGGGDPVFDGLWAWDQPLMSASDGSVKAGSASILSFLALPKNFQIGPDVTVTQDFAMDAGIFEYRASTAEVDAFSLLVHVLVFTDNTLATNVYDFDLTIGIPAGANAYRTALPIPGSPLAVTAGMVVQIFVSAAGGLPVNPSTPARVFFHFGHGLPWAFDTSFPAGDYQKVLGL